MGPPSLTCLRLMLQKAAFKTVILYSFFHTFTEKFYDFGMCSGVSMEPTLYHNDVILIKKLNKYSIQKGDIVIIRSPADPERFWCKRVIHLPGENVTSCKYPGTIPTENIWLEGDNKLFSFDSRDSGPVPKALILGKAMGILWPRHIIF